MKTIILFIGTVLILSSCSPCRRLSRKCPPVIYDSIIERVTLDTITLISPADTLWLQIPVEVPLNELFVSNKTSGPSVEIKVVDGILSALVICPEDSLKAVITELETRGVRTVEVPKYVDVKFIPRWCWIVLIYAIVITLLIVVVIYLKVKGAAFLGKL